MKYLQKLKKALNCLPALPFFILVFCFLLLPLLNTVREAFSDPKTGAFSFVNFASVFTKPIYLTSIENSVKMALVGSCAGIVISFFTALAVVNLGPGARKRFMPILNMTQNFAGFPLAFAFMLMLGHNGFIRLAAEVFGMRMLDAYNLYSADGLIPLFIWFAIPLGTLLLIPGFETIRTEWKESATLMGANGFQFWLHIGLPNLAPALFGTLGMLFADSITTYTTVYMIMGENIATLPVKIANMFAGDSKQQTELGSALSLTMIAIILLVMVLTNLAQKKLSKGRASK